MMSSKFTRLNRESNPPSGMFASPTPQYWDRDTQRPEDVEGYGGAPGAVLFGPNGQPITDANPLEVRVRELENELQELRGMFSDGDAKVQLSGHIEEYAVKSWGDLPPDSVPAGSVAMLIGTDDIRQSDGAEWVVLA